MHRTRVAYSYPGETAMSMQTVRRKALRQNPYSTLGKPPLRSSRDRITRAMALLQIVGGDKLIIPFC
ncbi:hypothetical protein SCH_043 (plasmid) [Salmonella enterica subsp. enterica serovar Choleraesuis str. SC-B67]|uniref:Uncharacterized protein n=2 Tax=Salmonella enterica TaxID=28901 RepID=Q5J438_SALCH|nr:hypothetical protein SCH_043 [Salmonella enterica subsp. enterica serovar Choleraesuis str. SC-B67]